MNTRFGRQRIRRRPSPAHGLTVCGIVLLGFGTVFWLTTRPPSSQTASTTGTVIGVPLEANDPSDGDGSETCAAIASFTVGGANYQTAPPTSFQSPCPYSDGQSVVVLYNPADPSDSSVKLIGIAADVAPVLIVVSVLMLVAAPVVLLRARRQRNGALIV